MGCSKTLDMLLLFLEAIHMLYLLSARYGNAGTLLLDAVGTINKHQLALRAGHLIDRQLTKDRNHDEVSHRRLARR